MTSEHDELYDEVDEELEDDFDEEYDDDYEDDGEEFDLEAALAELRGGGPAQDLEDDFGNEPEGFKSGFVTLVGRPNAGKSTLANALVGQKIAITSNTAQTTRHRLRAILDTDDMQMVLVDTPGIHKPHDALGEELNRSAIKGLEDVDVVAMLIDASKPFGTGDEWVIKQVAKARCRKILVISKADLADGERIHAQLEAAEGLAKWDATVVLSAKTKFNLDEFVEECAELLPEGPRWFPRGTTTDQPIEVLIAEAVREKVLRLTRDEVPHAVGVQCDEVTFDEDENRCEIFASIYVERESQKGILIGRKGAMIKQIGTDARRDITRLLGMKVRLDLKVKVKKDWRSDATQIRRFGYGEGA